MLIKIKTVRGSTQCPVRGGRSRLTTRRTTDKTEVLMKTSTVYCRTCRILGPVGHLGGSQATFTYLSRTSTATHPRIPLSVCGEKVSLPGTLSWDPSEGRIRRSSLLSPGCHTQTPAPRSPVVGRFEWWRRRVGSLWPKSTVT